MYIYSLEEIREIVEPIAQKYGVQAIYLFGSYARGTATDDSDLDFLVFGGDGFRRSLVYAIGEDLREVFHKDIDIFEVNEVNENSTFYRTFMEERKRVA